MPFHCESSVGSRRQSVFVHSYAGMRVSRSSTCAYAAANTSQAMRNALARSGPLLRADLSLFAMPNRVTSGSRTCPATERGEDAAPRMGAFMAGNGFAPQLILCSPAVRTRQTLDLVMPHLAGGPRVVYEDAFYLAAPRRCWSGCARSGPTRPCHDRRPRSGAAPAGHWSCQAPAMRTPAGAGRQVPHRRTGRHHFEGGSWRKIKPGDGHLAAVHDAQAPALTLPPRAPLHPCHARPDR